MGNAATGRAKGVLNRPVEGGELAQNTKKILNRRDEPKIMLKMQDLAFSGPQNELFLEFKKCQSKPKTWPKSDEQTPRDPALSFHSRLAVPRRRDRPAVSPRKSPERDSSLRSAALRMTGLGALNETGNWKLETRATSFQFLISSFHLPGGLWKLRFTVDCLSRDCSFH
jgi:hypothetical protein